MFRRLHLRPNFPNGSIRSDEESDSMRADKFETHEAFLPISAVGIDDFFVLIQEQRERQMVFLDEVRMRLYRICADAKNDSAFLFIFGEFIPESTSFFRATGRRIFGIKVEDDVFAAKTG